MISSNRTIQINSLGGLKFISLNINSIRGKILDLLASLDVHNPHIVVVQKKKKKKKKIDSSIATSELFTETCPDNIFRKARNLHGGGAMLLIHKVIPYMPLSEPENNSESVCVKKLLIMWQAGIVHLVAQVIQLFHDQLHQIRNKHKGNKLPSVHVLGDFSFKDIAWPDQLNRLNVKSIRGTNVDWHNE